MLTFFRMIQGKGFLFQVMMLIFRMMFVEDRKKYK
jgi:hypothetical protein